MGEQMGEVQSRARRTDLQERRPCWAVAVLQRHVPLDPVPDETAKTCLAPASEIVRLGGGETFCFDLRARSKDQISRYVRSSYRSQIRQS